MACWLPTSPEILTRVPPLLVFCSFLAFRRNPSSPQYFLFQTTFLPSPLLLNNLRGDPPLAHNPPSSLLSPFVGPFQSNCLHHVCPVPLLFPPGRGSLPSIRGFFLRNLFSFFRIFPYAEWIACAFLSFSSLFYSFDFPPLHVCVVLCSPSSARRPLLLFDAFFKGRVWSARPFFPFFPHSPRVSPMLHNPLGC